MGKISSVYIAPYSILRDIDPKKLFVVFFNGGYRFFTYVRGYGCGYVFLKAVCFHGIADRNQLKDFRLCIPFAGYKGILVIRIRPFPDLIGFRHGIDHILGRCIFFFFLQAVNGGISVDIRQETQQFRIRYAEGIFPVFIQVDIKITDNTVTVAFNNMNGFQQGGIQIFVFIFV